MPDLRVQQNPLSLC